MVEANEKEWQYLYTIEQRNPFLKSDPCLWGVGGGCKLVLGTFTNIIVEQVKKKNRNEKNCQEVFCGFPKDRARKKCPSAYLTERRGGLKAMWTMAKYTGHFSHGHFRSEKGSLSAKTSISLWLWLWKDPKPRTKELKLPPEYNYAHRNCNHPYNNFKQKQLSRSWFLWQLGLESIGQAHLITHFLKPYKTYPTQRTF